MAIPNSLPETLEAAVDVLQAQLSEEDQLRLAAMTDRELSGLHLSYGMAIRNNFGLWGSNVPLITALGCWEPGIGEMTEEGNLVQGPDVANADHASGIIITALVRRLRNRQCGPQA